jgi:hypothetical protein
MIKGIERQWTPFVDGIGKKKEGEEALHCVLFRLNMVKDGTDREGGRAGYVGRGAFKPQLERPELANFGYLMKLSRGSGLGGRRWSCCFDR